MSIRKSLSCCAFLAFLLVATAAHAEDKKGQLELRNWVNQENTVNIPLIKVRYTLGIFFGEPYASFIFYYEPIDDFTRIYTIKMTAQVTVGGVRQDAYIDIDPLVEAPGKWGWDVPGSPAWDQMFHSESGGPISKEEAKGFYRGNIGLTNLEIIEITARNGVDDAEYEEFAALLPTAYVADEGEAGPLDARLPPAAFGGRAFGGGSVASSWNGNMWSKRLTGNDVMNHLVSVREENSSEVLDVERISKTTWKYGQYQHAAIEVAFADVGGPDTAQLVAIEIAWEDWSQGRRRVRTQTYTRSVRPGQRLTVVDRVRRADQKDGSLAHYHVSYRLRFIPPDAEEEDPLAGTAAEDPLLAALEADQLARFDAEEARHKSEVAGVYADHEAEQQRRAAEAEARRLAQEQRRQEQEREAQRAAAVQEPAEREALDQPTGAEEALAVPPPVAVPVPSDGDYFVVLSMARYMESRDTSAWPGRSTLSVSRVFAFTLEGEAARTDDAETLKEKLIYRAWRDAREFFGSEDLFYEQLHPVHYRRDVGRVGGPWSSEIREILREQVVFTVPHHAWQQDFTEASLSVQQHGFPDLPQYYLSSGDDLTMVGYVDHSRIFDSRHAAEAFIAEQRARGFEQRQVGGEVRINDVSGLRRDDLILSREREGDVPRADHPYPMRRILRSDIDTAEMLGHDPYRNEFTVGACFEAGYSY